MNSLCGDELILGNKDGQYLRLSADEIVTMAPTLTRAIFGKRPLRFHRETQPDSPTNRRHDYGGQNQTA
jgi:hypothetical protein